MAGGEQSQQRDGRGELRWDVEPVRTAQQAQSEEGLNDERAGGLPATVSTCSPFAAQEGATREHSGYGTEGTAG